MLRRCRFDVKAIILKVSAGKRSFENEDVKYAAQIGRGLKGAARGIGERRVFLPFALGDGRDIDNRVCCTTADTKLQECRSAKKQGRFTT